MTQQEIRDNGHSQVILTLIDIVKNTRRWTKSSNPKFDTAKIRDNGHSQVILTLIDIAKNMRRWTQSSNPNFD